MSRKQAIIVAGGVAVAIGLAVSAAILVVARHWSPTSPQAPTERPALYRGSAPPAGIKLPQFSLPRIGGGTVTTASTRGKVVLTTFVDSACTESCPIIAGIIGQTLRRLTPSEREHVVPLAFSVNPPVDTALHVHRFLAKQRASSLVYLVAPTDRMRPVWTSFHVLPAVDTGDSDVHSADVRVFDTNGLWASTLHAAVDLNPETLVHDIRVALQRSRTDK